MFDYLVPRDVNDRKNLADILDQTGQVIHVGHVLLEKVIPWAGIYDRFFDANSTTVTPVACLAALPRPDGSLPAARCGEHPECLLHQQKRQARIASGQPPLTEETVACPLHFWGFRHIIEIPPQQVKTLGTGGMVLRKQILCTRPAHVATAIHAKLLYAPKHIDALKLLLTNRQARATWGGALARRADILTCLKDTDLDLIYLYCHTRGGDADPAVFPPHLEFQGDGEITPGIITAGQFDHDVRWAHHPLVIINGCQTAAFSADALSPFIEKFSRDRGAAGCLGTEGPVWEALATEFAMLFLASFLGGSSAGNALLTARRMLLAKFNPLGLVYTLYASADLALDSPAPNTTAPPSIVIEDEDRSVRIGNVRIALD